MNILVFSWRDPKHPSAGGAEQVMHEHMKGWIAAGHKVTLFTSKVERLPKKEILDRVLIIRNGAQYLGVQVAGFFYYLKNSENIDFIVDQFHGLPFFTPLYSNKPKIAVIQEVAGKVWLKNDLPRPLNWMVGIAGYTMEPLVFQFYKTTHFMTGSESTRKQLESVGINSKMVSVIPHGTKLVALNPLPKKEKKPTVMYLGAISMDKGIDIVLTVFNLLNRKGRFNFWIVGRASEKYRKYMNEVIKKFKLSSKVKFFGFVGERRKFELLARSNLLINPSILEGWGLVNIEANSVGTPVIAFNSPGLVDSVKDNVSGVICSENTPESMSNEVLNLLANDREYRALSKSAVRWSKKFSWDISKKMSLTLIKGIARLSGR